MLDRPAMLEAMNGALKAVFDSEKTQKTIRVGSPKRRTGVPKAAFFFQKIGPHLFGSPERLTGVFKRKIAPICLEDLNG